MYDPLTGLVRFGARDYDAEAGRWTAKDPAGFGGGSNTYEYGASQPHHAVDSDGEVVFLVGHRAADEARLGRLYRPDAWHLALVFGPSSDGCPCDLGGVMSVGGQRSDDSPSRLVTSWNNPGDLAGRQIGIVRTPTGMSDCEYMRALIGAARRYRNDMPYSVPLVGPPGMRDGYMTLGHYNSNSYVAGLVRAAGGVPPIIVTGGAFQVPGYSNLLPIP